MSETMHVHGHIGLLSVRMNFRFYLNLSDPLIGAEFTNDDHIIGSIHDLILLREA
jgi:hypothetical protein